MTILYFGVYNPQYARNHVIISGLRQNGVEVLECRASAKDRLWPLKLLLNYFKYWGKFDAMIVGFPGQEVMFLARLLTFKPIIFDAFTSHYGGYILDRKYYSPKSLRAAYYRFLDVWSCRLATKVLLDTRSHIDFFVDELGLPRELFKRLWIGANEEIFYPQDKPKTDDVFTVLYFGTYIPLQGVTYILKAAEIIQHMNLPVRFVMIGGGRGLNGAKAFADEKQLANVTFYPMASSADVAGRIADADVCLGIFGDTPKTPLVIPNKVFEAVASRKPVITADTPAIRELFKPDCMYLVPTADADALADGIIKLKNDPELRNRLAENGFKTFKLLANTKENGRVLKDSLLLITSGKHP